MSRRLTPQEPMTLLGDHQRAGACFQVAVCFVRAAQLGLCLPPLCGKKVGSL